MTDAINPEYYNVAECPDCGHVFEIGDVIHGMDYYRGAAIKYVSRAGRKSPDTEVQDLRKAIRCLELELSYMGKGLIDAQR